MKLSVEQVRFLQAVAATLTDKSELPLAISVAQIEQVCASAGVPNPKWITGNKNYRLSPTMFKIPAALWEAAEITADVKASEVLAPDADQEKFKIIVPTKNPLYVPDGSYFPTFNIIKSGQFYPAYIYGETGVGKTLAVEQACATAGVSYCRVNVLPNADEQYYMGGWQLVNGNTEWVLGPVPRAMRAGARLLLDEVDLATEKSMCLQPVLEGKSVFLARIGEWVHPVSGFSVFATGNTKGKGDTTGRYIGTRILNEAFLDRFAVAFEHPYPSEVNEKSIVRKAMQAKGFMDEPWIDHLVNWANQCRINYRNGVIPESVSPRKLVDIVVGFSIFQDKMIAINSALARFDSVTRDAVMKYYNAVGPAAAPTVPGGGPATF